jgi:hydrogenase nickel incorporation protein HypA/HybF
LRSLRLRGEKFWRIRINHFSGIWLGRSIFRFQCRMWYPFDSAAMHELGVAQNILEIVQQSVPENQAKAVREIRLRIGQLSGIVPDSLDFCFTAIINGTDMQQARLAIEQIPTMSQCKECNHRFGIEDWVFSCPVCRSPNLELISGKELEIVEIELADECEEAS